MGARRGELDPRTVLEWLPGGADQRRRRHRRTRHRTGPATRGARHVHPPNATRFRPANRHATGSAAAIATFTDGSSEVPTTGTNARRRHTMKGYVSQRRDRFYALI
jgi:hypothetical protein